LLDFGCKVFFKKDIIVQTRKIKTPDDIRPGTKKGKLDQKAIWEVEIKMPKKLMFDINKGYRQLDKNKVPDEMADEQFDVMADPADQQVQQDMAGLK
jgi:hypothetical protein